MADPVLAPAGSAAWVLGDAATVRGFRLAGLAGAIAEGEAEARAALARLRSEGAALVIVTERVAQLLGGPDALGADGVRPLVVVVPSAGEPFPAPGFADHLSRRVQRALGLSVERRA